MSWPLRLHILGAAGSGTTTLGRLLAEQLDVTHLDTDDFFWEATDPPYQTPRPPEVRLKLLRDALDTHSRWVLSGSLCGWGDPLIPLFDAVIFVTLPAEVRLARLLAREQTRYGSDVAVGGRMHQQHLDFIDWARGYDDPDPKVGRSRQRHEQWLSYGFRLIPAHSGKHRMRVHRPEPVFVPTRIRSDFILFRAGFNRNQYQRLAVQ